MESPEEQELYRLFLEWLPRLGSVSEREKEFHWLSFLEGVRTGYRISNGVIGHNIRESRKNDAQ